MMQESIQLASVPAGAKSSVRSIPKLIIQTGPPRLPLLLQSALANVKLLHPSFEYVFFDDARVESFVQEFFPEHREIFHTFRFRIQKYDFFRYLAIYQYGGFYLDLDVFLARELTPLLEAGCVFPFEELTPSQFLREQFRMDWHIGNYAFGAAPGHPFIAAIIENCLRARRDAAWVSPMMKGIPRLFQEQFYILNTTGPGLVSRTLAENPQLAGEVRILFPEDVRERDSWHQFGDFGVHQMEGSWRGRESFLTRRLFRIWDTRTLNRVLKDARQTGKTRHWPPLQP